MPPDDRAARPTAHDDLSRWKADGTRPAGRDAVRRSTRSRSRGARRAGRGGTTGEKVNGRKYNDRELDRYPEATGAKDKLTVVERPAGVKGLMHLPYRWVVERTNAWVGKYRRNSKDYERTTAVAVIEVSMIHLMLKRLNPDPAATQAAFRYVRTPLRKAVPVPG